MAESRITNRPVGGGIRRMVEDYGARVREAAAQRNAAREAARGRPFRVDPMGMADEGYDTRAPARRTPAAAPAAPPSDIEMTVTAPRVQPARRRPTGRSRELSADELNDMVMARIRGEAAPANESADRSRARANIAGAMPAYKKGGAVKSKAKPAAYKKGGSVKSAKRK